jgi:enamine deaminase RidA (YjgF/YER057c/UK114 family)
MSDIERKLSEAGVAIPEPGAPAGSYVPYTRAGDLVFLAGQVPTKNGEPCVGRLGEDVSVEQGYDCARQCGAKLIGALKHALDGDLSRVVRVLKLNVYVNSTPAFTQQPAVGNGASDIFVLAFGDAGRHARAAVSVPALPSGVPVEVDAIVQVR